MSTGTAFNPWKTEMYHGRRDGQDVCVCQGGGSGIGSARIRAYREGRAPARVRILIPAALFHDIAQRPFGGQRFPRTCYAGDRTGHEMIMTLLDRLDATDTHLYQEVSVVDFIRDENGAVAGAIALDRDGDVVLFRANATVLATGGGTQVYDISTNSATGTGTGSRWHTGRGRN